MKNIRYSIFLKTLLFLITLWTLTGCVKEDMSDCPPTSFKFIVKAYDIENTEITSSVNDVVLYVFDRNKRFVEKINTKAGTTVEITLPEDDGITVVAWGNVGGGNEILPALKVGDNLNNATVQLKAMAPRAENYTRSSHSPDELFMGSFTGTRSDLASLNIVPVYPKTGRMSVTVIGLQKYTDIWDDDYSIVISETYSGIDFHSNLTGEKTSYEPSGAFNAYTVYNVLPFNLLPSDQKGVRIDIYHGNTLLITAAADSGGMPFIIQEGRLLHVVIDLNGWEEIYIWKEFNV